MINGVPPTAPPTVDKRELSWEIGSFQAQKAEGRKTMPEMKFGPIESSRLCLFNELHEKAWDRKDVPYRPWFHMK